MKKELVQNQEQEAVETLRSSSSSRRLTSDQNELHSNNKHINRSVANVGCMAGVFHLFSSKYYSRRKFLTFSASGKNNNKRNPARSRRSKQELPAVINQSPKPINVDVGVVQNNNTSTSTVRNDYNNNNDRIISQEEVLESKRSSVSSDDVVVSRSPTIPAGIRRRSTSLDLDSSKVGRQMPLVARLMGLQLQDHHHHYHSPPPPPLLIQQQQQQQPPFSSLQSDEKRRKLLGALKKCDENLNTLKKIVQEAVQVRSMSSATPNHAINEPPNQMSNTSTCTEQPSPASVLDVFAAGSSPTSSDEGHSCNFPSSTTTTTTTTTEPASG